MTKTKVCECGGSYEDVKSKKERHMNSKKHQTFVASEKAREETIENKQEETIENKLILFSTNIMFFTCQ